MEYYSSLNMGSHPSNLSVVPDLPLQGGSSTVTLGKSTSLGSEQTHLAGLLRLMGAFPSLFLASPSSGGHIPHGP